MKCTCLGVGLEAELVELRAGELEAEEDEAGPAEEGLHIRPSFVMVCVVAGVVLSHCCVCRVGVVMSC